MWCTKLERCLLIILFLLSMNFGVVTLEDQVGVTVNRQKIINDLWALLGLSSSNNTSRTEVNSSMDSTLASKINIIDTLTKENNSISIKNETTNITSYTNLTDNNINISVGNSNNSEIPVSGNYSLSSANSTVVAINESNSLTEFTNGNDKNTSIITTTSVDNYPATNGYSTTPLNKEESGNETLVPQNQSSPNEIHPIVTDSTVYPVQYGLSSTTQVPKDSSQVPNDSSSTNCSLLPNFETNCQLNSEYFAQSDSLLTFSGVKNKMSTMYLQSCLLRYCEPGEWCLGDALDNLISESLNMSSKFCSTDFFACLTSIENSYSSCADYKKFKAIRDSLELMCKYKQLSEYYPNSQSCGFHLMKLISVMLADLERVDPITPGVDFCFTQKGYLMVSFNCLLTQCPNEFVTILTNYEPWKWFTEDRSNAILCRTYYECVSRSTTNTVLSTTRYPFISDSYTKYPFQDETGGTSLDIHMTTENILVENNAKSNEEQKDEKSPQAHAFGDAVADNSHMMASLTAMMVILMIGMVIMMVACWRHFKKNRGHRKGGYSKLKTGEC